MPDTFIVYGEARQVGAGADDLARIGVSGASLYYASDNDVSAQDVEVKDGEEIVVRGSIWMVSAQSTKVTVTPIPTAPVEEEDTDAVDVPQSKVREQSIKDEEKAEKEREKAEKEEAKAEKSSSGSASSASSK